MKISTEIASISKFVGDEAAVEYAAKAGFDAWDFSMFAMNREGEHPLKTKEYLNYARKLKNIGLNSGIVCNQSHAPFPSGMGAVDNLKRAIECTAEAGGNICVIHPQSNESPEKNAEMYFKILDFAKDCGVKIATENMWNWDNEKGHSVFAACATPKSFLDHLNAVDDEYFVACLDIGHAEMKGSETSAVEMIKALGGKLQALHIHDNDKLNDSHQIPFSMNMNFEEIAKALNEINYSGYFTLEACEYLSAYDADSCLEGTKKLAESARKFSDMFERI